MGQPSRGWPRASRGAARLTGADRRTSGWRNAADGGREELPAEGRQRRNRKGGSRGGPLRECQGDQPCRGWPKARGGAARRAAAQRRHGSPQATYGRKGGPRLARGRPREPGGGGSRGVGRRRRANRRWAPRRRGEEEAGRRPWPGHCRRGEGGCAPAGIRRRRGPRISRSIRRVGAARESVGRRKRRGTASHPNHSSG